MQKEKPLVQIVPECAEDVEGVAHVHYQTWLATYPSEISGVTREDIERKFADSFSEESIQKRKTLLESLGNNKLRLVAKENGKIIAFCNVEKEDEVNILRAIYILPEHQRKGIGSGLWEEARKFFDPQKPTWVEVVDYNEGAINFYKSKGFVATGNRRQDERFRMPSGAIFTEIEMIRPAEDTREGFVTRGNTEKMYTERRGILQGGDKENHLEDEMNLEFVRDVSWRQVFKEWRKLEAHQESWQVLWKGRGFDSWEEWRGAYIAPYKPEVLEWRIYTVRNPLQAVKEFYAVPSVGWQKNVYSEGQVTQKIGEIIVHPVVTENKKMENIRNSFPKETMLIGVVDRDNRIILLEGMHRACALATWNDEMLFQGQVTIALANWTDPIRSIGGDYK